MEISLVELERLLNEQKVLVGQYLLGLSYYYNNESTDGHSKSLPINKEKFMEVAMKSGIPDDIKILKKYNIK